jgi:acyl-CoA synthetase (AMP-forming)/AMP-acid ligase II
LPAKRICDPRSRANLLRRDVEEATYEIPQVKGPLLWRLPAAIRLVIVEMSVQPEAVISYCKRRLPPPLVPRFVIFMDDFPRTFIGKVLRRELAKRYERYISAAE